MRWLQSCVVTGMFRPTCQSESVAFIILTAREHRSSQAIEKHIFLQGRGQLGAESIGLKPHPSLRGTKVLSESSLKCPGTWECAQSTEPAQHHTHLQPEPRGNLHLEEQGLS